MPETRDKQAKRKGRPAKGSAAKLRPNKADAAKHRPAKNSAAPGTPAKTSAADGRPRRLTKALEGAAPVASSAKATIGRGSRLTRKGIGVLVGNWANRDAFVVAFFLLVTAALVFRLTTMMLIDAPSLKADASEQRTVSYDLTARRGTIYDRNGNILAISVDATSIYVNPSEVEDPRETADALAAVLGGSSADYLDKIENSISPTFNYIQKLADADLRDGLKAAEEAYRSEFIEALPVGDDVPGEIPTPLSGIHYIAETKRVYPYGTVGAQVIGAVGDGGAGISGIEATYDIILRGIDGSVQAERGKDGRPIPGGASEVVQAVDGQDIILALDIDLQAFVEGKLKAYGESYQSGNASSILVDGATGEIYAAASLPLYDRDKLTQEDMEKGATSCKAISSGYEPGSVLKSVTAGAALENKVLQPEDMLDIPAALTLDEYEITDAFEHGDIQLSFRDVLVHSSNIGMTLIEQKMGNEALYNLLEKAGFGQPTHVDYPGESMGVLPKLEDWNIVSQSNISFGQGIVTSPLQVASYYGAVANHGVQVQPHFLMTRPSQDTAPSYPAKRVLDEQSADKLEDMLRSVVEGHAPAADIEGYKVVGKTGTAEKASPDGGYIDNNHIVTFVGYIADSSSELVCLTSFDNPLNQLTAPPTVPLFNEIMNYAANRYMITPVDAITEAKAALAASAMAGELAGAGADASAAQAAQAAGQQGSEDAGATSAHSGTDAKSSLRLSTPRGYAVTDPDARPVLRGEADGWLLDTSG